MIKNQLKKVVCGAIILSSSLVASSNSLVGIEGGYGSLSSEVTDKTLTPARYTKDSMGLSSIGLKIGAESTNYRVFLSARYNKGSDSKYDYISTYGGELQYVFNVASSTNIFVGVNAGLANLKFSVNGENFSRTISDPYLGGDLGINIHMTDAMDLELGARAMNIQATNSKNNIDYALENIISGYASLIFKFKID